MHTFEINVLVIFTEMSECVWSDNVTVQLSVTFERLSFAIGQQFRDRTRPLRIM